jgi:hypothetical protein
MDGTAPSGSTARNGAPRAGLVFLGDVRLAAAAANHGRHYALRRVFGVTAAQENLLTFVLALAAAESALAAARRAVHAPFGMSRSDAAMGGVLAREAVFGIAGPGARNVPLAGALLTFAMLGALTPGVRRALHGIAAAEHRVRERRMSVYAATRRAASERSAAA